MGDHDCDLPSILLNKPSFNWESTNLHETFKLFRNQVKFLLVEGQYSKCDEVDKVRAILNWLGPKSYEVYEDLAMEPGENKKKCADVLKAFDRYFKPSQSLFQNLVIIPGTNCEDFTQGHASPGEISCVD